MSLAAVTAHIPRGGDRRRGVATPTSARTAGRNRFARHASVSAIAIAMRASAAASRTIRALGRRAAQARRRRRPRTAAGTCSERTIQSCSVAPVALASLAVMRYRASVMRCPASTARAASSRASPAARASRSAASRRRLAAEMRTSTGCASTSSSSSAFASSSHGSSLVQPRRRRLDPVHLGAERQDVEQRVEQRVADFLHEVGRAGVAHERRAGVPADDRARETTPGCRSRARRTRPDTCARCSCRTSPAAASRARACAPRRCRA